MPRPKVFDCITFFQENFITNIRLEILKDVIDYFVICESIYDHRGKEKDIVFKLKNQQLKNKVRHIILRDPFPPHLNLWERQAFQREYLFKGIEDANSDDYIMFSDPDEIPDPKILKNFQIVKKYAIFHQRCFNYKINLLNPYETPWSGTRITKRKNLKSYDYLRQKILEKNIKKWWKINIEKNISIIQNSGWHFNNLLTSDMISRKLKTFAHNEYSGEEFSNIDIIEKKIAQRIDLFNRGHKLIKVELDDTFPEYIIKNKNNEEFKKFII